MIEKLSTEKYVLWRDGINKINELVDAVNDLACLHRMFESTHNHSKPVGELSAKLNMARAVLDDLEEEIMKGSI